MVPMLDAPDVMIDAELHNAQARTIRLRLLCFDAAIPQNIPEHAYANINVGPESTPYQFLRFGNAVYIS